MKDAYEKLWSLKIDQIWNKKRTKQELLTESSISAKLNVNKYMDGKDVI